jgi:hypothetical protein
MIKVQPMIVSQMRCYKEWHFSTDKIIRETVQFYFWNGKFPNIWNESLLVPLYKKGNKIDPSNYTGISISSNLGKLFNRVIHTRLLQFIEESKIISKNQIGFMEKGRTADHLFSLTLINRRVELNSQMELANTFCPKEGSNRLMFLDLCCLKFL